MFLSLFHFKPVCQAIEFKMDSLAQLGTFDGCYFLSNLAKAPVSSFRGFQWGTFCLHCSEHRNVAETEGNSHFYSKGAYLHTHIPTVFNWWPVHYVPSSNISRPRRLIGYHLTYLFPQNEDSSTHEKLDFKLHFTCTSYLITTPCYRLVYRLLWSIRILNYSLWADDLQHC